MTWQYVGLTIVGYSSDDGGYSGAFSWWRDGGDRRRWVFIGHEAGFTVPAGRAVVDDFGSLVPVAGALA